MPLCRLDRPRQGAPSRRRIADTSPVPRRTSIGVTRCRQVSWLPFHLPAPSQRREWRLSVACAGRCRLRSQLLLKGTDIRLQWRDRSGFAPLSLLSPGSHFGARTPESTIFCCCLLKITQYIVYVNIFFVNLISTASSTTDLGKSTSRPQTIHRFIPRLGGYGENSGNAAAVSPIDFGTI